MIDKIMALSDVYSLTQVPADFTEVDSLPKDNLLADQQPQVGPTRRVRSKVDT